MPTPSITTIISTSNQTVKEWIKLHTKKGRLQQGKLLVEGDHLVCEAALAHRLEAVIVQEGISVQWDVKQIYVVSEAICQKLSLTKSKSVLFGIVALPKYSISGSRFLYCEDIQDPGNLGTLIRSAKSFGYDGILLSDAAVDYFNEKVVRASQGANLSFPYQILSPKELRSFCQKKSLTLVATDAHQACPTTELPKDNLVVVVGNEGSGVSTLLKESSDIIVKIETVDFESLNAAIAGSILMYLSRKSV